MDNEELQNLIQELRGEIERYDIDNIKRQLQDTVELLSKHKHTFADNTKKLEKLIPVTEHLQGAVPVTAANYGTIFINKSDKEYIVREVQVVWGTASTSGTLQVERLQGTEAKDAGDDLLTTAIDMSGTANTVNTGSITATKENLTLSKGDRLGIVNGGDLTSQADLTITVYIQEL